MKTLSVMSVLVVTALCATVSCAGARNEPRSSDDAEEQAAPDEMQPASGTVPAANACPGDDGKPLECSFNSECCAGTSCAFDPELSRVQKYCL
jgi:hypothetical protein